MKTEIQKPIKVALILGKFNPGGKKTLVMEYFTHSDPSVIQYHFICDSDSQPFAEEFIQENGGVVHYVAPYQNIVKNLSDIHSLCKQERFDVMHAYNSTMNVFPLFIAKLCDIPVRISESLSMAHEKEFKTYIKKALKPFAKLFATDYLACGEDCGRWQFGDKLFDAGRVQVFKTAIDPTKSGFNPSERERVRKELGLDEKTVIGFVGRFVAQKNPLFLLEVFKEINKLDSSAVLLLVGDGVLREEMLAYIDQEGLSDCVKYLGCREDIYGLYQAMDCFVLPSLYEGLPVVGLEAQCAGMPVFFSTEITPEASFCSLGHFLPLDAGAQEWARHILDILAKEMPARRGRGEEATLNGFDSASEGHRLQEFYMDLSGKAKKKSL